jgi:hypothetical protein
MSLAGPRPRDAETHLHWLLQKNYLAIHCNCSACSVPLDAALQKRANFSTLIVGSAGTSYRTRATCVAGSPITAQPFTPTKHPVELSFSVNMFTASGPFSDHVGQVQKWRYRSKVCAIRAEPSPQLDARPRTQVSLKVRPVHLLAEMAVAEARRAARGRVGRSAGNVLHGAVHAGRQEDGQQQHEKQVVGHGDGEELGTIAAFSFFVARTRMTTTTRSNSARGPM